MTRIALRGECWWTEQLNGLIVVDKAESKFQYPMESKFPECRIKKMNVPVFSWHPYYTV